MQLGSDIEPGARQPYQPQYRPDAPELYECRQPECRPLREDVFGTRWHVPIEPEALSTPYQGYRTAAQHVPSSACVIDHDYWYNPLDQSSALAGVGM